MTLEVLADGAPDGFSPRDPFAPAQRVEGFDLRRRQIHDCAHVSS
jgi:hypothetical protein